MRMHAMLCVSRHAPTKSGIVLRKSVEYLRGCHPNDAIAHRGHRQRQRGQLRDACKRAVMRTRVLCRTGAVGKLWASCGVAGIGQDDRLGLCGEHSGAERRSRSPSHAPGRRSESGASIAMRCRAKGRSRGTQDLAGHNNNYSYALIHVRPPKCSYCGHFFRWGQHPPPPSRPPKRRDQSTPPPDGSYFPIPEITEPMALIWSIAVHSQCTLCIIIHVISV